MVKSTIPLTQTQLGMYLEWNAARDSTQYNITIDHDFPLGAIDAERLAAAVRQVFAAYPVFRLRLVEAAGEIVQGVDEDCDLAVAVLKVADAQFAQVRAEFKRPFNLIEEPMARATVVVTESAIHLLTDFSHLISDGSGYRLFAAALNAAYQGKALPQEEVAFSEYALWESKSYASEDYLAVKADCAERFAGKSMTVPEDRDSEPTKKEALTQGKFIDETALLPRDQIEKFCRACDVHPNLFFMGAFARTLALYANSEEAIFFTVNHGRRDRRLKTTHGCLVKTVPVIASLKGETPLVDFLKSLRLHGAGVYPFTHFCRDLGMTPGFGYVFQDGTVDLSTTIDGVVSAMTLYSSGGVGHLPTLQVGGDREHYKLELSCLPGAYSSSWCAAFVERIAEVARQFLANADKCLKDIPVISAVEAESVIEHSRGAEVDYDRSATFPGLFLRKAKDHPERIATVDCEGKLTYAELEAASGALAQRLMAIGVKPGDFVGLKLPRRNSFLVSALAVQRCGAGYVPLDPDYPADRIAYMISDAGAKVVIDAAFLEGLESGAGADEGEARAQKLDLSTLTSPAYMIYTSGSTGKPKGVVIPQRALVAFSAWVTDELKLGTDSKMAVTASFSFDASVFDLFPVLTVGGEVHIFSESLRKDLAGMRDYARREQLTGWTMSTQLGLAMLNTYPEVSLKSMIVGGEKIQPFAPSPVKVYNAYGPTEFTVASSFQVVDQSAPGEVPIGRPAPNSYSFICDRLGQLMPRGMVGELCLAGVQIADGYWHNEEKTARAFVERRFPIPLAFDLRPSTMYRTGDYAKYDREWRLLYRGRIDSQVKLRGFRIEMGEIESTAAACPGVEAVAAEVKTLAGTQHLVLYYSGAATAETIRAKMAETLTGYMVPDYFVRLEKLPLTPVGKIDRKALPEPQLDDDPIVESASELEAQLLAAVREVLKTDRFGVTHDFGRLGLTSLGAMSLVAKLQKELGLKVTLSELAKAPSVRQLAVSIGNSAQAGTKTAKAKRPKRAFYPMTENQRGVYADWLKNPQATQYNVPAAFRFPSLDPDQLVRATAEVIAAHPAFKTRFVEKDGEIVQARRDSAELPIALERLETEPDAAFFASRMRPFSPSDEDLARFSVFAAPKAAYLFLDAHHTIFDGMSMGVFLKDLLARLDGKPLEGEHATAFDAGLDERDYLESELVAEDEAWFAKYLEGCESTSLEASEAPAAGIAPGTAKQITVRLKAAGILDRVAELGVSASDWFLTALMELLRRIGRRDEVQILFVSAGRGDADYANSVGMFVRTLPVRNAKEEATFSGAVKRLHSEVLELRDRDRVSYARLSAKNALSPEIIFAYEGGLFDLPRGASLIAPPTGTAKFPLSVTVTPTKEEFELGFEYDASRYGAHEMEQLLSALAHLAEEAVREDALRSIPLLDESDVAQAVAMAYGGELEYDDTKTFVNLFNANVIARPFATAVVDAAGSLTYAELADATDSLAAALADRGVAPGEFVAIRLGRVKEFVVAAIGIMKAGAAYVPIDPEYPADRIAYMIENSGAKVVIDAAFLAEVESETDQPKSSQERKPGMNLSAPASPAYMIYTSGSTGRPKGVVLPHRALRHLVEWACRDQEVTCSSRIIEHASFSFDASVISIFPVLSAGGELHILAEDLRKDLAGMRKYIVDRGITGATLSTQIGMALLDAYPELPLHDIMFGGEKLLPTAKTKVKLFNGYGPTEFCVCSSYQIVDQSSSGDIPIGRAVAGTWSLVIDRYGHLLPRGLAGEIALAGPQLADGYWHNPEKTAAVFTPVPFAFRNLPSTFYRTGDLARYDEQWRLIYLGRLDFQVKLRGFRIEIGEIEHAAASFPGVGKVAAEVRDVGGTKHLVLYYEYQRRQGPPSPDFATSELKPHLAAILAEYMVPDFYIEMDEMPMTPNGKINRKILPAPVASQSAHEYVAPREGPEKTIAEAWGTILKIERYGATDDFFASGGTSLLGIKAVVALQKAGLDVQYGDLFKHKTPRSLAALLTGETEGTPLESQTSAFSPNAYDYAAIDDLLAQTRTELFGNFRVHSLGDVLLTGATGYLGIHLLRYLLEKTSSSVTVLLRAKGKTGPERRLNAQYVYYFGEQLPRRYRDRLDFIEGDITDRELEAKLKGRSIATVINSAALVKHYIADDALDRVNVGGVENLLLCCERLGARFVQTSTYSIGGLVDAAAPVRLDERHLFVGQDSENDYIRTKFLAERATLAAVAAGKVRAKVMRLGNLMGREADGEFQMNVGANAFVNSLKSYGAIGAYPLDELATPLEMSPIDRVAEAICLLATTPDDMVLFHPYNAYSLDMGAVLGALNRRGHAIDFTSKDEFAARVEALRSDPSRADELQGILHYAQRHLDGRKLTPVANAWTTTVLYRLGFRWKPADDRYLASFFDMLEGLAVFERKK